MHLAILLFEAWPNFSAILAYFVLDVFQFGLAFFYLMQIDFLMLRYRQLIG
jgi:hypothetical protein